MFRIFIAILVILNINCYIIYKEKKSDLIFDPCEKIIRKTEYKRFFYRYVVSTRKCADRR